MATYNLNDIVPFAAIHPGVILRDEIKVRGMSQKEFAQKSGINISVLNEIIKGKRNINADYAVAIERVLGIPADSLMRIQSQYDIDLVRLRESKENSPNVQDKVARVYL